jgi:hypothetical protein
VGLAVIPSLGHKISFMHFVEQNKPAFFGHNIVINPNLSGRDEFINLVMATLCKIK